jgi:hypothetical protein
MSMDRGADDSIDTIRCGQLNRKLATSRFKERGELIRNHPDCRHSISQPGFEQLGVGGGRFPESQPCSDLGPMTLPGPACRVVPIAIIELRAKLPSHSRHSPIIDFCWLLGKSSIRPVKQEQHGEPKAVRTILRHNERLICEGQHPRFGGVGVGVIGHVPDSMRRAVAKLVRPATLIPCTDEAGLFLSQIFVANDKRLAT